MKKIRMHDALIAAIRQIDNDQCYEWLAGRNRPGGYPFIRAHGKQRLAHRVAYSIANDLSLEEMDGFVVRHSCDNPGCVNPRHLILGTQAENMEDMRERKRYRLPKVRGENNGLAKLNFENVCEIRRIFKKGCRINGSMALARRYGVRRQTIYKVILGITWRHDQADLIKSEEQKNA